MPRTLLVRPFLSLLLFPLAALTGCSAHYVTPGRGADFAAIGVAPQTRQSLTEPNIQTALGKRPLAGFPTNIAVVRLQAPGYRSPTAEGWGEGRYTIVTTRDVEKDVQTDRIARLPLVTGMAPLNRLLLPRQLNSDAELREAAAQLHCDMVLIYTIDTAFYTKDLAAPITLITLGLSPNQKTRVVTTASAVLMDTRNGYVYGVDEATEQKDGLATAWNTDQAVDESRLKTEEAAFNKLVGEFEKTWVGVVKQYAGGPMQNAK